MTFAVGDYEATELLGAGSSAQVWRGQRMATGEVVAMKVFPADQLAAVRREAALGAAVDHPHVVTVIDVVADEHRAVLVTEHAAGGDLADLLARRGRLSAGQTLTVLIPLAAALATAHERQIVHGDVSAANIVFDEAGRPLLADLGAARAAMESGRPVSATPCDAAPELARAGAPAPATDMFSLGSVALACLTGRPAWPADDLRDVLIQAAAGQWPDLPDDAAPAPLVAAIRSLLEHDPDRRPGAATLMLNLRSAGRPEALDLTPGRPTGTAALAAGLQAPPARRSSAGRHGRADDEQAVDDEPGPQSWPGQGAQHASRPLGSGRAPDAAVGPARALTRLRADTPPGSSSGSRPSSGDRGRRRGRRFPWVPVGRSGGKVLRIAAVIAGGLVVTVVAGLVGLWWAGSGRADPVAMQPVPPAAAVAGVLRSTAMAQRSSALPGPRPTAGSTARDASRTPSAAAGTPGRPAPSPAGRTPVAAAPSPTATPNTAIPNTATPNTAAPNTAAPNSASRTTGAAAPRPTDWTATVRALDQARAKALVDRDPALLDAVYTTDAAARSTDAGTIRTLVADGLRLSGASHEVQSVRAVTGVPTTILVQDSLPSYQLLDSTGSVIGRTPERAASPRVMVLVHTAAGYRISEVRTP